MCFYVSNTCSQIRFYKGKKYNNIIRGTYLFQDLCKAVLFILIQIVRFQ